MANVFSFYFHTLIWKSNFEEIPRPRNTTFFILMYNKIRKNYTEIIKVIEIQ